MAFQTYNAEFGQGGLSFQYVKSAGGTWRPLEGTDLAGGSAENKTFSNQFTGQLLGFSGTGSLSTVFGYNSGANQFVRIIDGTTTGGNVIAVIAAGAQNNFSVDFGSKGVVIQSGVVVTMSTSPTTNTLTSDGLITVVWTT